MLSKARALVDAAESINKAAEKVEAQTEAEGQQAREEVAPLYLKERVANGQGLPVVEVIGQQEGEQQLLMVVVQYILSWLKEDMFVELIEMLRYRNSDFGQDVLEEEEEEDGDY